MCFNTSNPFIKNDKSFEMVQRKSFSSERRNFFIIATFHVSYMRAKMFNEPCNNLCMDTHIFNNLSFQTYEKGPHTIQHIKFFYKKRQKFWNGLKKIIFIRTKKSFYYYNLSCFLLEGDNVRGSLRQCLHGHAHFQQSFFSNI